MSQDQLYDKARHFDTNAAKTFTAVYEANIPVNDYFLGFTRIHGAARTGKTFEQAVQLDDYTAALPKHIQKAAYNAGAKAGAIADDAAMKNATSVKVKALQAEFVAQKQEIGERFLEAEANGDVAEMNEQRKEYQTLEQWSKETIRDKKVQIGKAGAVLGQMVSTDVSVVDAGDMVREKGSEVGNNIESVVYYEKDKLKYEKYIGEVESITNIGIVSKQRSLLKEALMKNKYAKLKREAQFKHRKEFNTKKEHLIIEWEKNTRQTWPTYTEPVYAKNGRILRNIGDKFDAHHIIESSYGGPNQWWNIHPASFPNQHQRGIHGANSVIRHIFK